MGKKIKIRYSIQNEGYIDTNDLNPYIFCLELSKHTKDSDIFVTANATAAIVPNQALLLKKNQRFFTNRPPVRWDMAFLQQLVLQYRVKINASSVLKVTKSPNEHSRTCNNF